MSLPAAGHQERGAQGGGLHVRARREQVPDLPPRQQGQVERSRCVLVDAHRIRQRTPQRTPPHPNTLYIARHCTTVTSRGWPTGVAAAAAGVTKGLLMLQSDFSDCLEVALLYPLTTCLTYRASCHRASARTIAAREQESPRATAVAARTDHSRVARPTTGRSYCTLRLRIGLGYRGATANH
jgi:hypothetical protein